MSMLRASACVSRLSCVAAANMSVCRADGSLCMLPGARCPVSCMCVLGTGGVPFDAMIQCVVSLHSGACVMHLIACGAPGLRQPAPHARSLLMPAAVQLLSRIHTTPVASFAFQIMYISCWCRIHVFLNPERGMPPCSLPTLPRYLSHFAAQTRPQFHVHCHLFHFALIIARSSCWCWWRMCCRRGRQCASASWCCRPRPLPCSSWCPSRHAGCWLRCGLV